jgi:ankyrin repeat protein
MGLKLAKEKLFHSVDANNLADVRIVLDKYPALVSEYFDREHTSLPIARACWLGKMDMVQLLMERGADPKMPVKNGVNCVFICAAKGRTEILELLISKGCPLDILDDRQLTPLDIAIINGFYNTSLLLVKNVL